MQPDPTPSAPSTEKIRKALAEATPGPWNSTDHGWTVWAQRKPHAEPRFVAAASSPTSHGQHARGMADAHLIANAPTWLAQLCDQVDALTTKLAAAEAVIEAVEAHLADDLDLERATKLDDALATYRATHD